MVAVPVCAGRIAWRSAGRHGCPRAGTASDYSVRWFARCQGQVAGPTGNELADRQSNFVWIAGSRVMVCGRVCLRVVVHGAMPGTSDGGGKRVQAGLMGICAWWVALAGVDCAGTTWLRRYQARFGSFRGRGMAQSCPRRLPRAAGGVACGVMQGRPQ